MLSRSWNLKRVLVRPWRENGRVSRAVPKPLFRIAIQHIEIGRWGKELVGRTS